MKENAWRSSVDQKKAQLEKYKTARLDINKTKINK